MFCFSVVINLVLTILRIFDKGFILLKFQISWDIISPISIYSRFLQG